MAGSEQITVEAKAYLKELLKGLNDGTVAAVAVVALRPKAGDSRYDLEHVILVAPDAPERYRADTNTLLYDGLGEFT